ncbi:alpha/beta hydrolase [Flavihumibacter sp. UBA7668]|uniref:alpha/beta hydrolase n=1 Tax=Flavihumibacter sp. UBA7668 TaxID=1946542 RepID=UPI0025B96463|nr:alpha/beta hydrolase-fold protein [Flavihumibacter sp. UBA7668]
MRSLLLGAIGLVTTINTNAQLSTASPRVQIMDSAFPIKSLGRERRIWIYLPADYTTGKHRYPVLYMQDGQNLFDAVTSFAGEWGVDEELDRTNLPLIVVGIDNGGAKRMNEYNPEDHERFGKGEGKAYLEFLVNELKPYIDQHYRTKKQAKYTGIAGSSMGGLISYYAGLWYPKQFGKIGVFSPSFWISPGLINLTKEALHKRRHANQQYYFYAGKKESPQMVSDMEKIISTLQPILPKESIIKRVSPIGEHNEASWRSELPNYLRWNLRSRK